MKDQVAWDDPRSNRGYVKVGRERVTQSSDAAEIAALRTKAPDMKETMETGRDWDPIWKNKWPKEADSPGFKQSVLQFFQAGLRWSLCRGLCLTILKDMPWVARRRDAFCRIGVGSWRVLLRPKD
jgi:isopenicillin N synthase-like dioxygenase